MKSYFKFSNLFLLTICVTFLSCKKKKENTLNVNNQLLGSWEIISIHWITSDTVYSIQHAHPGIFIVDNTRYSTMWTPTKEPRIPFEVLSKPTDEETLSGFRSVVFNAGTYVMTDSTITTTATIAKVPGFEGGIQFYKYKFNEDTLELTMFDETYPNGDKPEWFGKYETKFILKKAI